ncbi:hypothetical protein V8C34DRAFT_289834 [Trichoderma compactum]
MVDFGDQMGLGLGCLGTFSPTAHKEAQSLPGSFQRHHVHRVSRTRGASSPALSTRRAQILYKYCTSTVHTRPMACSAPPLFYFFPLHLSRSCISSGTLKQPPGIL